MDLIAFVVATALLIAQRLGELGINLRNTRALRAQGAIEFGAPHYPLVVGLHSLFFVSLILEAAWRGVRVSSFWPAAILVLVGTQLIRLWVIRTLGVRWTTRILVLPGRPAIQTGPYRWFRHPNYWIVGVELITFPFAFGLWLTGLAFTIANAIVLVAVRVPAENRALASASASISSSAI